MNKLNILLLALCLSSLNVEAASTKAKLYYQVEAGDTFGTVIFSLGYIRLWTGSAYVNKFKNRINPKELNRVDVGDKIYFDESEIIFKKNIRREGDRIYFHRKIRKLADWRELRAREKIEEDLPKAPESIVLEKKDEVRVFNNTKSSYEIYLGAGGFVAQDMETDNATETTTMTGLQPLVQLKGIYSHSAMGSMAVDVLAKKIINADFSFPVNTDFRLQYIPKFINLGPVNLAFSYSMLKHSYAGKPVDEVKEYELSAQFAGIGLVLPRGSYWYEIYLEKSLAARTVSNDKSISLGSGWRLDSELIYPWGPQWRIIPGINYYTTENSSKKYEMNVLELRTTISWLFN
ncbi:MAG: hypothetical protein NDI69_01080 [Bacteriovoracaceae bacterium]|nr:hypothetical protein [Bacteriovoracaceae bacterium]